MRFWFGVGARRVGATVILQPFRWRWSVMDTPTMIKEFYLGPITLQFWKP